MRTKFPGNGAPAKEAEGSARTSTCFRQSIAGLPRHDSFGFCEEIDDRFQAFLNRPLEDGGCPCRGDATSVKLRWGERIVSMAITFVLMLVFWRKTELWRHMP